MPILLITTTTIHIVRNNARLFREILAEFRFPAGWYTIRQGSRSVGGFPGVGFGELGGGGGCLVSRGQGPRGDRQGHRGLVGSLPGPDWAGRGRGSPDGPVGGDAWIDGRDDSIERDGGRDQRECENDRRFFNLVEVEFAWPAPVEDQVDPGRLGVSTGFDAEGQTAELGGVQAPGDSHRPAGQANRLANLQLGRLRQDRQLQATDGAFELQADPQVPGQDRPIADFVERDMRVAAIGGEQDGAQNVRLVLDRKEAGTGVVVVVVQASECIATAPAGVFA